MPPRIFNIGSVTPAVDVAVSGLTLANGRAAGENPATVCHSCRPPMAGGGAVLKNSTGTLSLTACAVSGGAAVGGSASDGTAGAGAGGGIYASAGVLNLSGTTFANNAGAGGNGFDARAGASRGGAVCTAGSAVVNAVNCTLASNSATGGTANAGDPGGNALGGAIYHGSSGALTISQCTVSTNSATNGTGTLGSPSGQGGGIHRAGPEPVTLVNTIVAANTASTANPDVSGAFTSTGSNLIGALGTATGFANGANGDQVGTVATPINPLLGALASNGGPTRTLRLVQSTFMGNQALGGGGGGAGLGGAIFNYGRTVLVTNSALTGNAVRGGASENGGSGYGGAIFNLNGGVTTLHATLAGNTAPQGGGAIYSLGDNGVATQAGPVLPHTIATVVLHNTILSGSTDGANAVSDFIQNTNNSGSGSGATWFFGPDGTGNDFYIYRWSSSSGPTYSDGYGTQLSVSPNGSILALNSAGNLYLRVDSNAGLGTFWQLLNRAPVAGTDTIRRYPTQSVKVLLSTLLANDSDPDGDTPLTITAVNAPASGQATVTLSGGRAFYQPAAGFTGAATFTYQLSDGHGGMATGTVQVDIIGGTGLAQNITKIALLPGGSAGISFAAIPRRTYRVESTDSLAPANWQNRGVVTADATGRIDFNDPPPLPPSRFYRTVAQ